MEMLILIKKGYTATTIQGNQCFKDKWAIDYM